MKFHRVDGAKDRNFWSVRVSRGVRMIVHKTASNFLLFYVGEHDESYRWAERRRIERHPNTGAAQLVEIREVVRDIEVPRYVTAAPAASPLFSEVADNQLLDYGIPAEWLEDVRQVDDEDALLEVADHLPAEASEALVALATGSTPARPAPTAADEDPFAHPDAQRRFRAMANQDELQRALEYPWEKWTVFLHPAQRQMVRRSFHGPARVSGSAGTGKTIVALHRAVYLARTHPDARVLLTTFSRTSHQIRRQADRLLPSETSDVDGNTDRRSGTVSVFNGSEPVIRILGSLDEECAVVAPWLEARKREGLLPHEIGSFVRSQAELERATQAARKAGFTTVDLAKHAGGVSGSVAVGTMHLAKGMEFRAVAVVACDDEVLPLQSKNRKRSWRILDDEE